MCVCNSIGLYLLYLYRKCWNQIEKWRCFIFFYIRFFSFLFSVSTLLPKKTHYSRGLLDYVIFSETKDNKKGLIHFVLLAQSPTMWHYIISWSGGVKKNKKKMSTSLNETTVSLYIYRLDWQLCSKYTYTQQEKKRKKHFQWHGLRMIYDWERRWCR